MVLNITGLWWLHLNEMNIGQSRRKVKSGMKNRESPPVKPCIEKAPKLELKALPPHLRYVFLGRIDILPVIIVLDLIEQ